MRAFVNGYHPKHDFIRTKARLVVASRAGARLRAAEFLPELDEFPGPALIGGRGIGRPRRRQANGRNRQRDRDQNKATEDDAMTAPPAD